MASEENSFKLQIPRTWKEKIASNSGAAIVGRFRPNVLFPAELLRENFHKINVFGTVTMHDYETFGSNEHGDFSFHQETVLSTAGPSTTLLQWEQGFGGEERVEIDIVGSLNASSRACFVRIAIRFYEGATEGTTELEDSRTFDSVVPFNLTSNFNVHLANDEDDWARVIGSIGNSAF